LGTVHHQLPHPRLPRHRQERFKGIRGGQKTGTLKNVLKRANQVNSLEASRRGYNLKKTRDNLQLDFHVFIKDFIKMNDEKRREILKVNWRYFLQNRENSALLQRNIH